MIVSSPSISKATHFSVQPVVNPVKAIHVVAATATRINMVLIIIACEVAYFYYTTAGSYIEIAFGADQKRHKWLIYSKTLP
jgi:hypothetical protein